VLAEDPPVAAERGEALLHARAGRLDEADHRHARALGELEHRDDRVGVRLAERAAGERGVLGEAGDRRPSTRPLAPSTPSPAARLLPHAPRAHLGAQQVERAGIAEHLEALERRQSLIGSWDERERHVASRHSTAL
jgi:hypothetical protein